MFTIDFAAIFTRIYELVHGTHVDVHSLYSQLISTASIIAVVGLSLALVMLVTLVFVNIRLHELEHHGFHAMEVHDHAEHEHEVVHEAKNPRWEAVSMLAASTNESDWRRAIMEADIMLSVLLNEKGYSGATLGDQLKMANPLQFTTVDIAWEAHRMRNALAHLGEAFPLTERDARATIDQYRRVFEEFDYI
ncbi:MAG: hypothetical protein WCK46_02105 [Candidatus Adlerbacteria bacterium]